MGSPLRIVGRIYFGVSTSFNPNHLWSLLTPSLHPLGPFSLRRQPANPTQNQPLQLPFKLAAPSSPSPYLFVANLHQLWFLVRVQFLTLHDRTSLIPTTLTVLDPPFSSISTPSSLLRSASPAHSLRHSLNQRATLPCNISIIRPPRPSSPNRISSLLPPCDKTLATSNPCAGCFSYSRLACHSPLRQH